MPSSGEVDLENPTRYEQLLLAAVAELRDCPGIAVWRDEISVEGGSEGRGGLSASQLAGEAMADAAFFPELENAAVGADIVIEPAIVNLSPRFRKIASYWEGVGAVGNLAGEFRVPHFYRAIFEPAPPLAWEGSGEEERQLLAQFREIDGHPKSGTGLSVSVRLQPNMTPLEIWVWDPRLGAMKMDLDYLGYLEALALTKGAYGWQYLFTDASFIDDDFFHTAERVKSMLRVFPGIFPQYDYTDLQTRLEARL
ncbi:hypothetical protein AB0G77_10620 [Streptomyces hygroscopicus]|uniref:hypothetical protein n=1 Tax=Streptomyces hygroscopicus TaxID=1912 RepID=UPI0033F238B5